MVERALVALRSLSPRAVDVHDVQLSVHPLCEPETAADKSHGVLSSGDTHDDRLFARPSACADLAHPEVLVDLVGSLPQCKLAERRQLLRREEVHERLVNLRQVVYGAPIEPVDQRGGREVDYDDLIRLVQGSCPETSRAPGSR